jgi:hypothetical protein
MSKKQSVLAAEKPSPPPRTRLWISEVWVGPDGARKRLPALTKTHCHDPIDEILQALKDKRANTPTLVKIYQAPRKQRQKGDYEQIPLAGL